MAERPPSGWIVDTNVVSRPSRKTDDPDPPEARWVRDNAALIRLSVVTVAEARRGLMLEQQKIDRRQDLRVRRREQHLLDEKRRWYGQLRSRFADRIIPIDVDVAERWADVSVRFPSLRDGDKAIIATALVHGYGVATRNLRDFQGVGLPLVNPFDPATWWDDEARSSASRENPAASSTP